MSGMSTEKMTELNALQRLIQARRDEKGWSYGDIAAQGELPKSTVYKLATQPWEGTPRPDTLDKLARGLQLPPAVVRKAASEATGLTAQVTREVTDEGLDLLIGTIETLTIEQRQQLWALVSAMVAQQEQ